MTAAVWCKSGQTPVREGRYRLADGTTALVRQSRGGKFYAATGGQYRPGLIWRLSAELDAGTAVAL